jgi:hypothetical protein
MGNTNHALRTATKNKRPQARQSVSYQNIAGGLASEMVGFLRSTEPREFCPPFKLVIIGNCGTVVFECEVGEDGKVRPWGSLNRVRRSHFPATALLTDRSLLTRTFLIERPAHRNGQN